ncbi:LamG domain-containing protein [Haloferula chungangensis]|uniref:LamG domain-containing protein n=1 Tax=Haloferula chungangensis TaxID=1048331 RepID=A0ABW2L5M6_9BACT
MHWTLDEASGLEAYDSSGNEIHGTWAGVLGSPGWMPGEGMDGGSVYVSGANADTFINDTFSQVTSTPLTISVWVKTTASASAGLVYLGNGATGNSYYVMRTADTAARLSARNTTEQRLSGGVINDGEWHHVLGVYASPTERSLYVDGIFVGTQASEVTEVTLTRFGIGGLTRNTPHAPVDLFTGELDDVALWDSALSAAEVAGLHGLGTHGGGNAADLDTLMDGFAAKSDVQIRGIDWEYTTGLEGPIGTTGGSILGRNAFIVLDEEGNGMKVPGIPGNPVVTLFESSEETIFFGEDVTLSWDVENATAISIDQSIGSVANPSGSLIVSPEESTTYTLEATNGNGTSFGQVTVTVIPEPIIHSFTASKLVIFDGEEISLNWDVENVVEIDINQGVGAFTDPVGNTLVSPSETTLYTLTAYNDQAESTAQVEVTVYPALPPRELLLHWPLDESEGSSATDLAGDNPGSFLETGGTISRTGGLIGSGAVTFPGASDVAVRAYTQLVEGYPFVMSAWIKVNAIGNQTFATLGTGSNFQYQSMRVFNGTSGVMTRNSGSFEQFGPDVNDGQWHSIVGVYSHPSSLSLYVDGVFAGERTTDSGAYNLTDRFSIGALDRSDTSVVDGFNGSVDDVSFWRGVLSASEVAVLHGGAAGLGLNASEVAALLTAFDEQQAVTVAGVVWTPVSELTGIAGATAGSLPGGASIVMDDLGNGMMTGTVVPEEDFHIISIERDLSGTTLVWTGAADDVYSIEFSTDLLDWSDVVASGVASQGETTSYKDTDSDRLNESRGFYRVLR